MSKYCFGIFWMCILIIRHDVLCQQMRFDHISVEDGLSQANVLDIYQDRFGFIWIATEDGLNQYNGYEFKTFFNEEANDQSLAHSNVTAIAEDSSGNIWVSSYVRAISKYERASGKFVQYRHEPSDPNSLGGNVCRQVLVDSVGNVWISTDNGLSLYRPNTDDFENFYFDQENLDSDASSNIYCIAQDNKGLLWVGVANGAVCFNPATRSVEKFISTGVVSSLLVDNDENVWIGTFRQGLAKYDPTDDSIHYFEIDPTDPEKIISPFVYDVAKDPQGTIWIANDGALLKYQPETASFKRFQHNPADEFSLSSSIATKVFFDKDERMWVGTRFGGVNVFDREKYVFNHFQHLVNNPSSISGDNIQGIAEDADGNVWIAVDGDGFNKLDPSTQKFERFRHESGSNNTIPNDKVLAITVDQFGDIWLGMWIGGLTRYNPKANVYTNYFHDPQDSNSLSDNSVFNIFEDSDGELWIATFGNGFNRYRRASDDFEQFTANPNDSNSIGETFIDVIVEDHTGLLWLGTETKGLYSFDKKQKVFTNYRQGNSSGSLTSDGVYVIHEDSQRRLWVGTNAGGLNEFDRQSNTFLKYDLGLNRSNETIVGILEDDQNNLWLSSNNGIYKFNKESGSAKNYVKYGIQARQFNRWSYLKGSDGIFYFGGLNGLNYFDPSNIMDDESHFQVYITDLWLYNKPVDITADGILQQDISQTRHIVLNYDQNFITLGLTAINYRYPELTDYRYILEGLHDEWVYSGKERRAHFTNLDPGEYTFKATARMGNGLWSNQGVEVMITVVPPFWAAWWFRMGVVIIAIGCLYAFYSWRVSFHKRRKKVLARLVRQKTDELRDQNKKLTQTIDELKDTQIKLIQSEKMSSLGQLTAGIAHEINNPVQVIQGNLDVLRVQLGDDADPVKTELRLIDEQTHSIFLIVN
ncbi:MAG: hypothetical protein JXQ90_01780, partial [Cyclobacteriaceae bacterium]